MHHRISPDSTWTHTDITDEQKLRLGRNTDAGGFDPGIDKVADEMGLSEDDVFQWDGKPRQVVSLNSGSAYDRDNCQIRTPTNVHPHSLEADPWTISLWQLYAAWRRGTASPAGFVVEGYPLTE